MSGRDVPPAVLARIDRNLAEVRDDVDRRITHIAHHLGHGDTEIELVGEQMFTLHHDPHWTPEALTTLAAYALVRLAETETRGDRP